MLKATTLKGHSVIAFSLPPLCLCTLRGSSTFCSCCNDFSTLVQAHACVWTWITKESRSECAFTLSLSCLARIPVHNYLRIHSHYLLLKTIFYTLSHVHTVVSSHIVEVRLRAKWGHLDYSSKMTRFTQSSPHFGCKLNVGSGLESWVGKPYRIPICCGILLH